MKIIGRRDFIDIPEWGLSNIEAKIDSGAYGCALHCHHMEVIMKGDIEVLRFQLFDPSHPEYEDGFYYTNVFRVKKVKSSTGHVENRFTVKTRLKLYKKLYMVEFSLTDRREMKYPVLIGRKFLRKKFLVDVSRKNIFYNLKNIKP